MPKNFTSLCLGLSDWETFLIIRKHGRPALDRLKRMHLKRDLKKWGSSPRLVHDILDDFDLYSEVRNDPQRLYNLIKWYVGGFKQPPISEFHIRRTVLDMIELEQAYGSADKPVVPYCVDPYPYFSAGSLAYTTWSGNTSSYILHNDAEVLNAWKKELEEEYKRKNDKKKARRLKN